MKKEFCSVPTCGQESVVSCLACGLPYCEDHIHVPSLHVNTDVVEVD